MSGRAKIRAGFFFLERLPASEQRFLPLFLAFLQADDLAADLRVQLQIGERLRTFLDLVVHVQGGTFAFVLADFLDQPQNRMGTPSLLRWFLCEVILLLKLYSFLIIIYLKRSV